MRRHLLDVGHARLTVGGQRPDPFQVLPALGLAIAPLHQHQRPEAKLEVPDEMSVDRQIHVRGAPDQAPVIQGVPEPSAQGFFGIGLQVAIRANAFDMRVLAVDPTPAGRPEFVESIEGSDGLHPMLGQSDFAVICCPETRETRGMIGREEFQAMKPTAFLFNVGRGPIVDQDALVEALRSGEIAGAGLDAMSPEPLPADSPLWDMPNVIITPHHAGQSPKAPARRFQLFCENLKAYVEGRPLTSVVDKNRMY